MISKINNLDNVIIRKEENSDYFEVEKIARDAFWNIYFPGCDAHYLIHQIRNHKDFLPEYDFVATINGKIVGSIFYTQSWLESVNGFVENIITFGPISILPEYQRKGIGSMLIKKTIAKAQKEKVKAIVINGNPSNYSKFGFVGSKKYSISNCEGRYPTSLLVKIFQEDVFRDQVWKYTESPVFNFDPIKVNEYDSLFEPKIKGYDYRQEEFNILANSFVE
jgi:putative acetyltransferase